MSVRKKLMSVVAAVATAAAMGATGVAANAAAVSYTHLTLPTT